jgi:probable F420-dependent oxidoreductase
MPTFGCSVPFGEVHDLQDFIGQLTSALEARGFESVWTGEHTHMPVDTHFAYTDDGRVPVRYRRIVDPWTVLTAIASLSTTLRLGTLVCLVGEHNPLRLGKQIATLDQLSGGRVEFGVGYGWNKPEMLNNGVDPGRRKAIFREKLQALKRIWTHDSTAFEGEHVRFTESWVLPHPKQRPHPPILLGAAPTDRTLDDVATLCDGYLPVQSALEDQGVETHLARLKERVEREGRDPSAVSVTISHPATAFGVPSVEKFLARMPDQKMMDRYMSAGVRRVVCTIPVTDPDLMMRVLDAYAGRIAEFARG